MHSGAIWLSCFVFAALALPLAKAQAQNYDTGLSLRKEMCRDANLSFCGQQFRVTGAMFGETRAIRLPDQYAYPDITLQCVSRRDGNAFIVVGAAGNMCELKTCKPSTVRLCDEDISVGTTLSIGQSTRVSVPTASLTPAKRAQTPAVAVQCRIQSGGVGYEVMDKAGLSCNDFPCKPVTMRLCGGGVKVDVTESIELGQVLKLKTDAQQPVTVQCIGSVGHRPTYQITDSSRVICN